MGNANQGVQAVISNNSNVQNGVRGQAAPSVRPTIASMAAEIRSSGYQSTRSSGKPYYPPLRIVGSSKGRPQREEESIADIEDYILDWIGVRDWRAESPSFLAELNGTARELHEELNASENDPKLVSALKKFKPGFLAENRSGISRAAELAAIHRTAHASAVRDVLKSSVMGRPLDRSFITALFEYQAYGWARPELRGAREDLLMPNGALDYVFDDARNSPGAKDESSMYQTFGTMLERHSADVLIEQNVEAVKALHEINPLIGKRCAIDATKISGPFQQGRCRSGSRLDEVLSRGQEVAQIDHDGDEVTRGWYILVIADIDSGVPIVWKTFPGTKHVQQGSIELVEKMYELWKDCPIEILVGDKEFSLGKEFSRRLIFNYGVHPIFPLRGNHGKGYSHHDNMGVPFCDRHERLMWWKQLAKFVPAKKRRGQGLEPGDSSGTDTHMVWFCPDCQKELDEQRAPGGRKTQFTRMYVKNHPLLYTTMPMRGKSRAAYERKALERYRTRIEALFSAFKRRGNGHAGVGKCMWSETIREAEWLNGGTLHGITLTCLVHRNGDYVREADAMRAKGLVL